MVKIDPSEITPEHLYLSRRRFLAGLGALALSSAVASACGATAVPGTTVVPTATAGPSPTPPSFPPLEATTDELGAALTTYQAITNYNNFYEFTSTKEDVASLAAGFQTTPWTIQVGGMVQNPRTYTLDDIYHFPVENRVYRLRCVEAWSMVIPWVGFPLSALLDQVQPTSQAKYVRFTTLLDPAEMPGQRSSFFQWPYVEGLRLDEAMHNLTILALGLYGKPLPPQDGAPVRLVVPWKYGFKSIKSIVKIELVDTMPTSFWMIAAPTEYGFWANVNPAVPHPRWSQATERRIGVGRIPTVLFNGYGDEVSSMYQPPDDRKWYY